MPLREKGRKPRLFMLSYVQHAHSSLTQLATAGADIQRIADRAVSMWRDLDAALSPIIGQRGVAALFKRSLFLTDPAHIPATSHEDEDAFDNFTALRATLEHQSSANAIATNDALLQKFVDLLTNLIGESLTERLLHSARDNPSSDGAVRETSS
jgi:hypothetical protein